MILSETLCTSKNCLCPIFHHKHSYTIVISGPVELVPGVLALDCAAVATTVSGLLNTADIHFSTTSHSSSQSVLILSFFSLSLEADTKWPTRVETQHSQSQNVVSDQGLHWLPFKWHFFNLYRPLCKFIRQQIDDFFPRKQALTFYWNVKTNYLGKIFKNAEIYILHTKCLTLKMPRKPASENVVCLCHLLNILANFPNLFLHTGKQCGSCSDCI